MIDVESVYRDRNGDRTKALYEELLKHRAGPIAINLLRISKNSRGGKNGRYSGRGRRAAYDSKDWAIGELCTALLGAADELGITWGWGFDAKAIGFEQVLYVDLPGHGQVSFHTRSRRDGPNYAGVWDGPHPERDPAITTSARRAINFAQSLINGGRHDEGNRTAGEGASGDAGAQDAGEQQEALDL